MRYGKWLPGLSLLLGCALLVPLAAKGIAQAESTSSCVTCHLDEDMLIANLAEVKSTASAKQAGSG